MRGMDIGVARLDKPFDQVPRATELIDMESDSISVLLEFLYNTDTMKQSLYSQS